MSDAKPTISSPLSVDAAADAARAAAAAPPSAAPAAAPSPLLMANAYVPKGDLPNTPLAVSAIAAGLGALVGASLLAASPPLLRATGAADAAWARPQLGIYLAAIGVFHLAEFWTTAGWNADKLSVDAFLLNNTAQYHYAHAFGLAEYFVSSYLWPSKFDSAWQSPPVLLVITLALLGAQAFRSLAMIHASASFSHIVKAVKLDDHVLVTHGVYAYSRHPSYAGFFYWAVLTQLLLGNVAATLAFVAVLGRFFAARIAAEERFLVKFFGDDYVRYRARVGTGLPFAVAQA
ncbi:farnesyl cysteine-carboxyl methyltransferase [Cryptotrichosporon argae]